MKRQLLFLISIVVALSLFAQNNATISGKIIESESKSTLPYATILLYKVNSENQIAGTITNEKGLFSFNDVPNGEFQVRITYLGFKTHIVNLLVGDLNKHVNIGVIELDQEGKVLNEIVVNSQNHKVSPTLEKKSYSLVDDIAHTGGSILNVMRSLPGITIDQEGKISLRGSDKVTVLIDGKQSSLTGYGNQKSLDNIAASNIEKIEIINNPSAKLEAAGMGGIINIIYKKESESGLKGDVGFHFGLGEFNTRKENLANIFDKYSFTPKYNPALSINYRQKKFNFFLQTEGMFRKKVNANEFKYTTYADQSKDITSQFLENRSQQLYNIKLGFDWNLSSKDLLTIFGLWEDEFHIDRGDVPFDYTHSNIRKRLWSWAEDERTYNMNYQINFRHDFFQPGHKFEMGLTYSHGVEDELFPFVDKIGTTISKDSTHLINKEKNFIVNFDYTYPFKKGRLESGIKLHLRKIPISYHVLLGSPSTNTLDLNLGDWSKYEEDNYSFYVNYVYESKHLEIEAGARLEYSYINYKIDPQNQYYHSYSYDEFPLFPNIRLTYKLNNYHKISLFYNKRVDRPTEFDLRPFPKYDEPEVLRTGNPYLHPQYTNNFEIAYKTIWQTGSMYLAGYYKKTTDTFTRVLVEDKNINSVTQNLGNSFNKGLEIVWEQSIIKNWNLNANFNWFQNVINGAEGFILYPKKLPYKYDTSKNYSWNVKINTLLNLPKNYAIQGSYIYYAPDIIPQGKIKKRSQLDLGLNKTLYHKKIEISLSALDILNTAAIKKEYYGNDFSVLSEDYFESQVVTLGLKYKF